MDNNSIKGYLNSNIDLEYKEFQKKIIPTVTNFLGVRLPMMKSFAKQIAKGDYKAYLKTATNDTYEETLLWGLVICNIKADFLQIAKYIKEFVPKIDNWGTCDSFCSSLKIVNKNKAEMFKILKEYLKSKKEYELRFAIVMLMDYYITDEYIDDVLMIYNRIKSDQYYVQMAIAWGLSMCFVKFQAKTMQMLKNNNLDDFTYNKALQKIVESNRVSSNDKVIIKNMKRVKQK